MTTTAAALWMLGLFALDALLYGAMWAAIALLASWRESREWRERDQEEEDR